MTIREVTERDFSDWLQLACSLWPDSDTDEMRVILMAIYQSATETAFLARDKQGVALGFMNLSLRSDYVPGATHRPVAYVEGIYVRPEHQQQGIGRALIGQAECWAKQRGSRELASDAELDNTLSERFHSRMGFDEVDRTISFIKKLAD